VVGTLRTAVSIGWVVAILGVLSWLLIVGRLKRSGGVRNVLTTALWALIASGAVLGALVAAAWLVRSGRAELHPWFAAPWRLFTFMTTMVVTVSWMLRRVAAAAPPALRPDGTPFGVWLAALPAWTALLIIALRYAPAASYLVSVPLLAAIVFVIPTLWLIGDDGAPRTWPARVGGLFVVAITWVLWAPDVAALLPFAVTLLGRMPVVTPTWAYPAVFFMAGVVLWPPVLAVLVGRVRWRVAHRIAAGTLMFALVVTGVLAWAAPAFTNERPQQRSAIFVDDRVRGVAYWELYGNEPGVDIAAGGPTNVAWQVVERSSLPGRRVDPKAHLFRAAVTPPATAAPAVITASIVRRPGDADVEITVTAHDAEWQAVAIVLPEAIVPTRSTLAGRTSGGRWQAWLTTLPTDGISWRGTIPASQADRLSGTEVWVARARLPEAVDGERVPAWLRAPHTAWMTQHVIMLGVTFQDSVEAPALSTPVPMPLPSAAPTVAAPLPPAATPSVRVPR
jgi:hypothetical protein